MKNSGQRAEHDQHDQQNSVEASRSASRLRCPARSSSVKTGTNAALSAASANRLRTRFGTWKAIVNADDGAAGAEVARGDDLAHEPGDARAARSRSRRSPCCGPAARRAARPRWALGGRLRRRAPVGGHERAIVRRRTRPLIRGARLTSWPTSTHRRSASCAPSASGSRTAATRRRSRPTSAASRPPSPRATTPRADAEHRELRQTIDKAVKRGALHRNTGARKKSRAARLRAGQQA